MGHRAYRRERLMNRTRPKVAFAELLDRYPILYEVEAIFLNGDRYIFVDFYIKSAMLATELDGQYHEDQIKYNSGRSKWLLGNLRGKNCAFQEL